MAYTGVLTGGWLVACSGGGEINDSQLLAKLAAVPVP